MDEKTDEKTKDRGFGSSWRPDQTSGGGGGLGGAVVSEAAEVKPAVQTSAPAAPPAVEAPAPQETGV